MSNYNFCIRALTEMHTYSRIVSKKEEKSKIINDVSRSLFIARRFKELDRLIHENEREYGSTNVTQKTLDRGKILLAEVRFNFGRYSKEVNKLVDKPKKRNTYYRQKIEDNPVKPF